ncbi:hypothetical protein, partial [Pseudonocardia sp. SID8383]|uniref:hypothetical protein n=1 Tax=Pseudonocardia sp. SID8383 TaxID=2690363 RepID=UPI00136D0ABB
PCAPASAIASANTATGSAAASAEKKRCATARRAPMSSTGCTPGCSRGSTARPSPRRPSAAELERFRELTDATFALLRHGDDGAQ